MNKARLLALVFSLILASSPAWANCCMMGMGPGSGMMEGMGTGSGMMGGMGMGSGMMDGMGMGHGMMDGMGMGHGMMGGMGMGSGMMGGMGMSRGQQACLMQSCWHDGMAGVIPQMTVQNVFREISGYQVNAAALGLSEEQLQRLNDLKENLTALMIRTHADLQISGIDFRRAMSRENPDVAAAEKIIDRNGETLNKLQKTTIKAVVEARNVLTAQQRQQARQMATAGPRMQRPGGQQPAPETPEGHEQHH
jgi:Spy/CpxP family protein refolding chaperone